MSRDTDRRAAERAPSMRGLTIQQPWAFLIAHGVKKVENRTWTPPRHLMGKRIAIHAGKGKDCARTFSWSALPPACRQRFEALPPLVSSTKLRDMGWGVILATARLADCVPVEEIDQAAYPFAFGPWCWVLEDVRRLDVPIPHVGRLGLWPVDAESCSPLYAAGVRRGE